MSLLSTAITVVVVLVITTWLRSEPHQPPRVAGIDGAIELRHGQKYLILAVGCTLFGPVLFLVLMVSDGASDFKTSLWFPVIIAIVVLIGLWMLLDALRTRVIIQADGILAITPLGGSHHLRWDEIGSVSWNPFAGWLILRSRGRPTIRVSDHLHGRDVLIARLRDQAGEGVFRGAARFLL